MTLHCARQQQRRVNNKSDARRGSPPPEFSMLPNDFSLVSPLMFDGSNKNSEMADLFILQASFDGKVNHKLQITLCGSSNFNHNKLTISKMG